MPINETIFIQQIALIPYKHIDVSITNNTRKYDIKNKNKITLTQNYG